MIGLVTATMAAPLDGDLPPLTDAFRRAGMPAAVVAWDDDRVDWTSFDLVIVRSTWDYVERADDFRRWVDRVDALTTMWNPAAVLAWNIDKRYLTELGAAGVPVVPTTFVEPGDPSPALDPAGVHVVKPSVGAGSRLAARVRGADAADQVARIHAEGLTAMIQPYLDLIDSRGETGLVYAGDGDELEFQHAYSKGPILTGEIEVEGGFIAVEQITRAAATERELVVAAAALSAEPVARLGPLAYARVDLVPTAAGPVVLELELIEPSLRVDAVPGSADAVVARWAKLPGAPSGDRRATGNSVDP